MVMVWTYGHPTAVLVNNTDSTKGTGSTRYQMTNRQIDRQTDRTLTTFAHHINTEYTVITERQSTHYKQQLHQNWRQKTFRIIINNYKHVGADIRACTQRFAILSHHFDTNTHLK
jgi:hypothetical protein